MERAMNPTRAYMIAANDGSHAGFAEPRTAPDTSVLRPPVAGEFTTLDGVAAAT
jgi:hypothetical protein